VDAMAAPIMAVGAAQGLSVSPNKWTLREHKGNPTHSEAARSAAASAVTQRPSPK